MQYMLKWPVLSSLNPPILSQKGGLRNLLGPHISKSFHDFFLENPVSQGRLCVLALLPVRL
jgi:hypothetical protein